MGFPATRKKIAGAARGSCRWAPLAHQRALGQKQGQLMPSRQRDVKYLCCSIASDSGNLQVKPCSMLLDALSRKSYFTDRIFTRDLKAPDKELSSQILCFAATTPATTPAAFPALEPFQEALPLRSVESVQSFVDEAEDAEVKKRPSQPAPWATKPRQTPLKLLGKGRNGAEGVSTPLSTPKPFLVSGKRPVEQDLSTTRTKVSRFAAVPSGLPTTPQPIKRQPDLLFKPSAPSSSTPAFDSSPPIFPTTATAAPVGNDKTSGEYHHLFD